MKKVKDFLKSDRMQRLLYAFVLISFIVPVVYLVIRMVLVDGVDISDEAYRSRADYLLMIVQCVLGIFVLHVPTMLARKFRFVIPRMLYILYIIFLYCAIFLGEVQKFYYAVPFWDVILHAFSSMMTGFFGFMVIVILNRDEHIKLSLSPFFCAIFAFSFAMTVGALWEIYEFLGDGFFGLNMQKFITDDGSVLVGREALLDTMEDFIVDGVGALLASIIGYISIKVGKGWESGIVSVKTIEAEEAEALYPKRKNKKMKIKK